MESARDCLSIGWVRLLGVKDELNQLVTQYFSPPASDEGEQRS